MLVYTIDKNMKTFLNSDRFKIMKKAILLLLLFCIVPNAHSQVTLSDKQRDVSNFPVVTSALKAVVCYDKGDAEVVRRTAGLLVEDINRVTGKRLKLVTGLPTKQEYVILAGTLEKSKAINRLVRDKKIDISKIRNGWEQYVIDLIDNPFPGIKKALVVAGSDRHGLWAFIYFRSHWCLSLVLVGRCSGCKKEIFKLGCKNVLIQSTFS